MLVLQRSIVGFRNPEESNPICKNRPTIFFYKISYPNQLFFKLVWDSDFPSIFWIQQIPDLLRLFFMIMFEILSIEVINISLILLWKFLSKVQLSQKKSFLYSHGFPWKTFIELCRKSWNRLSWIPDKVALKLFQQHF